MQSRREQRATYTRNYTVCMGIVQFHNLDQQVWASQWAQIMTAHLTEVQQDYQLLLFTKLCDAVCH